MHHLRIIGLVEAGFNIKLKIFFAKQMIVISECNTMTEEQWGGKSGRTVTDVAMRKMVGFKYGQVLLVLIAFFANNVVV